VKQKENLLSKYIPMYPSHGYRFGLGIPNALNPASRTDNNQFRKSRIYPHCGISMFRMLPGDERAWQERANEYSQNHLSGEFASSLEAAYFPTQIPRCSYEDQSVGLIRGRLELQGANAPCKHRLSNLFACSLARQRSCTPLG
jgi:hypothetical protein